MINDIESRRRGNGYCTYQYIENWWYKYKYLSIPHGRLCCMHVLLGLDHRRDKSNGRVQVVQGSPHLEKKTKDQRTSYSVPILPDSSVMTDRDATLGPVPPFPPKYCVYYLLLFHHGHVSSLLFPFLLEPVFSYILVFLLYQS